MKAVLERMEGVLQPSWRSRVPWLVLVVGMLTVVAGSGFFTEELLDVLGNQPDLSGVYGAYWAVMAGTVVAAAGFRRTGNRATRNGIWFGLLTVITLVAVAGWFGLASLLAVSEPVLWLGVALLAMSVVSVGVGVDAALAARYRLALGVVACTVVAVVVTGVFASVLMLATGTSVADWAGLLD